ncbi:hypothetical protein TNCV_244061 [Trichonephila clavipes]|uniref:Uncharacterized protein n=1 Tax=Trichonephila clavipes TaxID=2585209 RepID=A0A8X6RQ04_TRICX|nr:hypothetical protein TNCV_244061 [Trichonephila clavipes]
MRKKARLLPKFSKKLLISSGRKVSKTCGFPAFEHDTSILFTCRNCGGGDRGRVAIYRPFGELRRAKIVLSPVWCSRSTTGVPLAHATMNFVGLDLTTSDSLRCMTDKSRSKERYEILARIHPRRNFFDE